ncbi:MAG: hexose kinase [Oscillospiraceae bacterium]|nr:hexose kinase [Oscillospiraceae bacterium]
MKIYTLTLNPAYDVHATASKLALGCENLADINSRQAGGKGVNISRALQSHQVNNTAVIVLGKENSGDFIRELEDAGLNCLYWEREGRIRENLTVHSTEGPETRISFRGFSVDETTLTEIAQKLSVDEDTIVTFTGSIPAGIDHDSVLDFLRGLTKKGAKLVLDSKSLTLEDIFTLKPWLIKPNQEEISAYFNYWIESLDQALEKAAIFAKEGVTNVMVSLGHQGALLINDGKTYLAKPPVVDAISTIGAGDSAIAGFLAAALQGKSPGECLRTAVTYGTAACLTEGTLPPLPQDTAAIFPTVTLEIL